MGVEMTFDLDNVEIEKAIADEVWRFDLRYVRMSHLAVPMHLVIDGVDVLVPPWMRPGSNRAPLFETLLYFPRTLEYLAYERSSSWELYDAGPHVDFSLGDECVIVTPWLSTSSVRTTFLALAEAMVRFTDAAKLLIADRLPKFLGHPGAGPWLQGERPWPDVQLDEDLIPDPSMLENPPDQPSDREGIDGHNEVGT